jgi:citrate lyase beta subunit
VTTPAPSLDASTLGGLLERLGRANREVEARYPIESGQRTPVHTVYGGGHLFKADTAAKLGQIARRTLDEYGADPREFARDVGLGVSDEIAAVVHARVRDKLEREAVEDFRIDFEDGYGNRPDAEEDGHVVAAARELARGRAQGTLPPFVGIRIKSLTSDELARRSLRTLDLFLTTAIAEGGLPPWFVITIPKITAAEQLAVSVEAFEALERKLGLPSGRLVFEMMVETTQSMVDAEGRIGLPRYLEASRGRCVGAHFGTYDYTASCNITATHQRMGHPACDFAKHVMQVSFAGRGIALSDGSTTTMPVPVHRAAPGQALTAAQTAENRRRVHEAWRLHVADVRHSLAGGFYQGWDLHPGQLVTRYAALFAFFLEGLPAASARLKNFVGKAAQATLVGDVFDDAATGQGLLNYFLRGINCGALSEDEALACGLTLDELRGRSFLAILKHRRG